MKSIIHLAVLLAFVSPLFAQDLKTKNVPAHVQDALRKKYPEAVKVSWEKEKGNYEANWGGKSGEDHSAQFTPTGDFIEIVNAVRPEELPAPIGAYIKEHYRGVRIKEAGRVTNAKGQTSYEVEVHGKDILFDGKGRFVREEK